MELHFCFYCTKVTCEGKAQLSPLWYSYDHCIQQRSVTNRQWSASDVSHRS